MSLVSTYVRAVDGKLYRDPVFRGDFWFLCFDDDDPPELVVKAGHKRPGFTWFKCNRYQANNPHRGTRSFGDEWCEALSYLGRLVDRIPVPTEHGGFVTDKKEIPQACIYDPKPKKKKRKQPNGWIPFDEKKGNQQKLAPEGKTVFLALAPDPCRGTPASICIGYMKFHAGEKDAPYFVIPGFNGVIVGWRDCVPAELGDVPWIEMNKQLGIQED